MHKREPVEASDDVGWLSGSADLVGIVSQS